jgi:EAL domain-containing protein (putative c-di-GMP-specific phosphodiesterase class I)
MRKIYSGDGSMIQNIVVKLGIDYSQGYYFSEPLPQPLLGE